MSVRLHSLEFTSTPAGPSGLRTLRSGVVASSPPCGARSESCALRPPLLRWASSRRQSLHSSLSRRGCCGVAPRSANQPPPPTDGVTSTRTHRHPVPPTPPREATAPMSEASVVGTFGARGGACARSGATPQRRRRGREELRLCLSDEAHRRSAAERAKALSASTARGRQCDNPGAEGSRTRRHARAPTSPKLKPTPPTPAASRGPRSPRSWSYRPWSPCPPRCRAGAGA